jgi:hypothetical protein
MARRRMTRPALLASTAAALAAWLAMEAGLFPPEDLGAPMALAGGGVLVVGILAAVVFSTRDAAARTGSWLTGRVDDWRAWRRAAGAASGPADDGGGPSLLAFDVDPGGGVHARGVSAEAVVQACPDLAPLLRLVPEGDRPVARFGLDGDAWPGVRDRLLRAGWSIRLRRPGGREETFLPGDAAPAASWLPDRSGGNLAALGHALALFVGAGGGLRPTRGDYLRHAAFSFILGLAWTAFLVTRERRDALDLFIALALCVILPGACILALRRGHVRNRRVAPTQGDTP